MARIGITLDDMQAQRLNALAKLDNKKPTTLATEILLSYMTARAEDIEKVLAANAEYERAVEELRKQKDSEVD